HEHYYIVNDRHRRLAHVRECCTMSDDHCTSCEQRLPEQLPTQEKQRNTVCSEEIKRIGVTGNGSIRDTDCRCNREYRHGDTRQGQIETLVVVAPRCPDEEQARRNNYTEPAVKHIVTRHAIDEYQVQSCDHCQSADRQLKKAHARAHPLQMENLE